MKGKQKIVVLIALFAFLVFYAAPLGTFGYIEPPSSPSEPEPNPTPSFDIVWVLEDVQILDPNYELFLDPLFTQFVIKPNVPGTTTATYGVRNTISHATSFSITAGVGFSWDFSFKIFGQDIGLSTGECMYTYSSTTNQLTSTYVKQEYTVSVDSNFNGLGVFSAVTTVIRGILWAYTYVQHLFVYEYGPNGEIIEHDLGPIPVDNPLTKTEVKFEVQEVDQDKIYGAKIDDFQFARNVYYAITSNTNPSTNAYITSADTDLLIGPGLNEWNMETGHTTTISKTTTQEFELTFTLGTKIYSAVFYLDISSSSTYTTSTTTTEITSFAPNFGDQYYRVSFYYLFCNGMWVTGYPVSVAPPSDSINFV